MHVRLRRLLTNLIFNKFIALIKVDKRDGQPFYKPSPETAHVIELSYYANTIVPHFALESIMLTALHNLSRQNKSDDPYQVRLSVAATFIEFFLKIVLLYSSLFWPNSIRQ